jgi:hypothetical protein
VTSDELQRRISDALAAEVTLHRASEHEVRIEVPFYFPDGDGLVIYLRDVGGETAELTDHAHTLMHIGYHTDVDRFYTGTRAQVFERVRTRHGVEDRDGELVVRHLIDETPQALFSFVQALIEISDIRHLDKEIVRSTFADDLKDLLVRSFEEIVVDYVDRKNDTQSKFPIPYVLNSTPRPIAIYDIATDDGAATAFAIASQHARWDAKPFHLVAIERDQSELARQRVAWISDLFDKQFASLAGNEETIVTYLHEQHALFKQLPS